MPQTHIACCGMIARGRHLCHRCTSSRCACRPGLRCKTCCVPSILVGGLESINVRTGLQAGFCEIGHLGGDVTYGPYQLPLMVGGGER